MAFDRACGLGALTCVFAMSASCQTVDGWGVYSDIRAEALSNGMPVLSLDGDWSRGYDQREGAQRAYASARVEAGVMVPSIWHGFDSPWRIGALTRADASAVLSGQAAQVVYFYQSQTNPGAPSRYNADASVLYWKGHGLAVHMPTLRLGGLALDMGWDHLVLSRLRSAQTEGEASYDGSGTYGYQMTARDDSWRTTEQFMRPPEPRGVGDALSMSWSWHADPSDKGSGESNWMPSKAKLTVDDVWSELQWQGINGNDAVLNSQVSARTPDGYLQYQAAIQGRYSRRTMQERIPVSTQLQLDWQGLKGSWGLRVQTRLGLWQRWLSWQSDGTLQWLVGAEPLHKALELGMQWRGLSASLKADSLSNGAHVQGAQLGWIYGF